MFSPNYIVARYTRSQRGEGPIALFYSLFMANGDRDIRRVWLSLSEDNKDL